MYLLKKFFPHELEVTKDGKMKNEGQIRKERCKTFVKIKITPISVSFTVTLKYKHLKGHFEKLNLKKCPR